LSELPVVTCGVDGAPRKRRLRNGVNHVSGYLLGFGLLAFVVGLDPWSVYSDRGDGLDTVLNLQSCGFFGAISIIGYRLFAHPRLDVHPDHLVIVGVLRDISAPLTAVTEVDTTSSEYVRLRINGRFRAVPGLEQRNLNTLPGQGVVEQLMVLLPGVRLPSETSAHSAAATTVRFSRLERNEVVLLVLWISYTVVGVLSWP
jgi:hypothetical protein